MGLNDLVRVSSFCVGDLSVLIFWVQISCCFMWQTSQMTMAKANLWSFHTPTCFFLVAQTPFIPGTLALLLNITKTELESYNTVTKLVYYQDAEVL